MQLLNGVEVKTNALNADLPQTTRTLATARQLERVMLRYLVLVRRMGLPDDAQKVIDTLAKILVTVRMLQMSINMLATGIAGGSLLGVLSGIAGLGILVVSAPQMLEGY